MNLVNFFARRPTIKALTVFVLVVAFLTGCSSSSDGQTPETSASQIEETDQATKEVTSNDADTDTDKSDETVEETAEATSSTDTATGDVTVEKEPNVNSGPAQRIQFTTGDIGARIEDGILQGEASRIYVLRANAQQLMQLKVTSLENNASLDLEAPNGEKLVTGGEETKILLPVDGDYLIYINPLRGNVSYIFDVLITDPVEFISVQFEAGSSSTSISGGMLRGETGPVYDLVATAGQRIDISITSLEENASFDVLTPSGEVLLSEIGVQGFDFSASLPETGQYLITTNALRGNVSFTLDISIRDDVG
jgi:hypothetical protein